MDGAGLVGGDVWTVSGYNMQTGIRTTLEADITEEGALVLPARLFGEIIRRLPDDIVKRWNRAPLSRIYLVIFQQKKR
mgnify:CR=1 FL=1